MAFPGKATKDFFISYNQKDKHWAEWVAWELEEAGYTAIVQAWDFGAGSNFVVEMDEAAKNAERTLALLSPTYIASIFTRPEWAAAFADDPTSVNRKLIPIRVEECELTGLLRQIVYIDLVGKEEQDAREILLAQIKVTERAKPATRPSFMGSRKPEVQAVVAVTPSAPGAESSRPGFPTANAPFQVPYPRLAFFTGRDDQLNALHQALIGGGRTTAIQALTGLGGIGKTQMAVEYAYQYREEYSAILWARAENEQQLKTDFVGIAKLLDLPEQDAPDQDETREAVKQWLTCNEKWLLILDNVDAPAAVKPFLPVIHNGCVLLTTRSQDVRALGIAMPLTLPELSPNEAQAFLLKSTGRENAEPQECAAAKQLGVELGGLPLALEQAAAYVGQNDTPFQSYLKSFKKRRLALLNAQDPVQGDYAHSVATTWDINFQVIQRKSPASVELLNLSAFLAPERIPLELLIKSAALLGPKLEDALDGAGEDELVLDDLLHPLTRYSLAHRQRQSNSYDVHRLVQAVTRQNMDDAQREIWTERAVRAVSQAFPEATVENWPACERLLSHALICADHIAAEGYEFEGATLLLIQLGNYLYDRAHYALAEPLMARALALREKTLPANDPQIAERCNNLALVYYRQQRYAEAEDLYTRALHISEEHYGPEHPEVGHCLNNLAVLYRDQCRYNEAEVLYLRALHICEAVLGPEHQQTAISLNNLANLLFHQGRLREMEPLYRRAYRIVDKTLGSEHPDIALILNNLAELYEEQNRYVEAGTLYRRALGIFEKAFGTEHPFVAYVVAHLAALYDEQGKYDESEAHYCRALSIFTNILGCDHKETTQCRDKYTALLRSLGRDDEADTLTQNAQIVVQTRESAVRR